MEPNDLKASFTKRYVVAISLIGILSSITFSFLYVALNHSDSTALVVNMSGKQRMLSQRILSLSQRHFFYSYITPDKRIIQKLEPILNAAIMEMRQANEKLSSGHLNENQIVALSESVYQIYFGKSQLRQRVIEYLDLAEKLKSLNNQEDAISTLNQLHEHSENLLPILNNTVHVYQTEGEVKILNIKHLELLTWILTILTLLLEIIFIYQPMSKKIHELFITLKQHLENLEHEIALRTKKLQVSNEKLMKLASHDPLTGLKNRLNMEQELEEIIAHYQQNLVPYAVVMLDIDWFKKINDNYGHDAGDFILKEFSKILEQEVRVQDSVYRIGGEEFIIVFNRITKEQVTKKMIKIRNVIEEMMFMYGDTKIQFTISCGLYHPESINYLSVEHILKAVDDALYKAKHSGRNQIVNVEG